MYLGARPRLKTNKMKKIIEGNKLIAEFMGFVCDDLKEENPLNRRFHGDTKDGKQYQFPKSFYRYDSGLYMEQTTFYPKNMKYHTSWDWLMPVVEKIGKSGWPIYGYSDPMANVSIYSPIELVYTEVLKFIQMYNTNQAAQ